MASAIKCFSLCAILGTLPIDGVRRDSSSHIDSADDRANQTQGAFDGVTTFLQASKRFGSAGNVAGQLVRNIESGVQGTVTQSNVDDQSDVLKLHVVHSKTNRGEIATPSKVPIWWVLEKETTYTLQKDGANIKLSVQGMQQLPFSEGLELYKNSGVMETCATKKDILAKVKCERKELFKYFEANWNKFNKDKYMSDPDHKLARIFSNIYGSWLKRKAIKASGGTEGWEKIVYAFVTIPPQTIDYWIMIPDSKGNEDDVEVAMVAHEIKDGAYAHLDFLSKHVAEADPVAFEKDRAMGESFARSSMNFAAMGNKGRLLTTEGVDIKGGTAKYILKAASPCQPKAKKYTYNDASSYCTDDHGRLYWH